MHMATCHPVYCSSTVTTIPYGMSAYQVQKLAMAAGAMKCTMLAVNGAFHTPLMQPARDALIQVCGAPHLQVYVYIQSELQSGLAFSMW